MEARRSAALKRAEWCMSRGEMGINSC
jgi:hypothetical protein